MRFWTGSKILVLALLFAFYLTPLFPVYAQQGRGDVATPRLNRLEETDRTGRLQQRPMDLNQKFEDRIAQMRQKIASREAQFKLRVDQFEDKVKAKLALKVNRVLNQINQNQTQQMNKHLNKMSEILDRVVTGAGGNASSSAQVAEARSAIETAQTAVETQAGRDYTINVSTESAIRKDAQTMRDRLRTDLRNTRQLVIGAKQAVAIAIRGLTSGNDSTGSGLPKRLNQSTQSGMPAN